VTELTMSPEEAACSALVATLQREGTAVEGLACRTWMLERSLSGQGVVHVRDAVAAVDDAVLRLRHSELARAIVTSAPTDTIGLDAESSLVTVMDEIETPWNSLLETQRRIITATLAELDVAVAELRHRVDQDEAHHRELGRLPLSLDRLVPRSLSRFLAA